MCPIAVLLAVLALGASEAQAHTTIVAPPGAHFPYQQWVDEAKVPTPDATIAVVEDAAGCQTEYGYEAEACVDLEAGTIYLDPGTLDPRLAFWHEVGHVFDRAVLTEGDRDWFAYLIDRPVTPWLSDSTHETAGEIFAEAYSVAAHLGPHIRAAQLVVPPDERIGRRKNFQIWTLIERSYLRALGQ